MDGAPLTTGVTPSFDAPGARQIVLTLKQGGLFALNFGSNPMKEGIERIVNGLPEQNLGVLAPWREIRPERVDSRQAAKTPR